MQLTRPPLATPQPVTWAPVLRLFGVMVRPDLVYDLAAGETVPVPMESGTVMQRYPYFIRAQSTGRSVVNSSITDVVMPWASTVDTSSTGQWQYTPLLVTSRAAGAAQGTTNVNPTQPLSRENLASRLLAVQVSPRLGSEYPGRAVVIGSSQLVATGFGSEGSGAVTMVLNALDWLAQDEALISIRSRDTSPPMLTFVSRAAREGVKYANVAGVPILVVLLGLVRLARRRRRVRMAQANARRESIEAAA
jgi:ABC-type uncharacterized transport system involved in gliding motility auxiliary subunit